MNDQMWRRLGQFGYGGTPPIVPQQRSPNFAPDLPMGTAAPRSRRQGGGADNGTVALALSGVSLYWTLPALLSMQGNRRRRRRTRPRPS